eukprot:Rhum_TRINITY_DN7926_c0_g1::Rhum_TRINITY_DN7926_c0_g1_i1::g.25258::m.25258
MAGELGDDVKKARKNAILKKYLNKKQGGAVGLEWPQKLWVTVFDTARRGEHIPNPHRGISGLYMLVPGTKVEGMPLWEQVGDEGRIEATVKGHWVVTHLGIPKLMSVRSHDGSVGPTEVGVFRSKHFETQRDREMDAALECGNGLWGAFDSEDVNGITGDACINASEAKVHGFRYGRAVVCNKEIVRAMPNNTTMRIPVGCLGIVIGRAQDAVQVKFDSVLTPIDVPNETLDLAEGPSVTVTLSNGMQLVASIVNVTDTRVKLHFSGRGKAEDQWYDKESPQISPHLSDNPDGLMDVETDSDGVSTDSDNGFGERGTYL